MNRHYAAITLSFPSDAPRQTRMRAIVDAIWDTLHETGISWVGFYVHEGGEELVLSVCRNKPACSPIGMHGACGAAFQSGEPLVVRDVKDLGANYVACDPRDQSEVVIPCHENGRVWGVLDLDSFDIGAFDESDVQGLTSLLIQAGLTT
ncbi:MAG TPA: GAF domain-containing protein [Phycisphaerae bacterium]|nr:GAF domain-containing protein [Phycisphaerae bacterium]HRW53854.1 GAF domain-containing protein [Phycisphaerae bacterium]